MNFLTLSAKMGHRKMRRPVQLVSWKMFTFICRPAEARTIATYLCRSTLKSLRTSAHSI